MASWLKTAHVMTNRAIPNLEIVTEHAIRGPAATALDFLKLRDVWCNLDQNGYYENRITSEFFN